MSQTTQAIGGHVTIEVSQQGKQPSIDRTSAAKSIFYLQAVDLGQSPVLVAHSFDELRGKNGYQSSLCIFLRNSCQTVSGSNCRWRPSLGSMLDMAHTAKRAVATHEASHVLLEFPTQHPADFPHSSSTRTTAQLWHIFPKRSAPHD